MARVFSCPGFMAILYWMAYVMNSKELNRKNGNGIGIIVMVKKTRKL